METGLNLPEIIRPDRLQDRQCEGQQHEYDLQQQVNLHRSLRVWRHKLLLLVVRFHMVSQRTGVLAVFAADFADEIAF
jgi:hypothetical protein